MLAAIAVLHMHSYRCERRKFKKELKKKKEKRKIVDDDEMARFLLLVKH